MTETLAAAEPTGGFAGVLRWMARRPRLILALFCLILWTPGVFSLPPLDRDESRFAQASKQMLETGDLVDIRFGHVPRYKKPVGIYWMQAAATQIASMGDHTQIWTYRLPSLLGAILAVWLTFWCARAFAPAEVAFLAGGLLGGTLLLSAEATIATTDAVLTACVLGMQGMLARAYMDVKGGGQPLGTGQALAGWVALGLGILVKGPAVLVVPAVSIIVLSLWDRDVRWLRATRPLIGIPVVLLIAAPWFVAIGIKSHWNFFQQSLGQDFATKLQGGQESHGAPPGSFLAAASITFWPATLFLLPALAAAIRAHKEPAARFLLIWASAWAVFELIPTKLPHYVLPVYPALAIMAAAWVMSPRKEGPVWERALFYIAPVQFAAMSLALAAAPVLLPRYYGDGSMLWAIAPGCLLFVLAIAALVAYFRRASAAAAVLAMAAPLLVYPVMTAGAGPRLTQLWVSPRVAVAEQRLKQPNDPPPALAGYVEPSLVFLLGTETRQTDGRGAAEAGAAQGGLALVEDRENGAFKARLAEMEADATEVGAVDGFNYSRGKKVHIRIYRVSPVRESPPPPAE
jgi:4-amino-4-deoxy-L-arabinose transferase-like glycosyltransferase